MANNDEIKQGEKGQGENIVGGQADVKTSSEEQSSEEENVSVPKSQLDHLLQRMKELEQFKNEFERTAPKDQIAKIDALRAEGKLVKSVKVRSIEGKYVLGWKTVSDKVWFADKQLFEEQIVAVYFEDGSSKEMNIRDFSGQSVYHPFEVISEQRNQAGDLIYKVKDDDGKELNISNKYVN